MSTRGAIARLTSKPGKKITFKGRYNQSDSYCDGLGSSLFQLRNGFFKGNTNAMLSVLIDQHKAGWSSICNCDFSITPGFQKNVPYKSEMNETEQAAYALYLRTPQCYCHGDRHEDALLVTEKNARDCDCEYVYAFTPDGKTMLVLDFRFEILGSIDLNGLEPTKEQWKKIPIEQVTSEDLKNRVAEILVARVEQAEKERVEQAEKKLLDDALEPLKELMG
jgi:hypothetical protein